MNLNKAFVIRNKLKNHSIELLNKIELAPKFFDDQEKLDKYVSENNTSQNLIADYLEANMMLSKLKDSIEQSNVEAKQILSTINMLKQNITILDTNINSINTSKIRGEDRISEIVDGMRQLSNNYKVQYFDMEQLIELRTTFKKQLNKLEDELSVVNNSTIVDVSSKLSKYIETVLY